MQFSSQTMEGMKEQNHQEPDSPSCCLGWANPAGWAAASWECPSPNLRKMPWFPPFHDITQMSSGLLGRAGKTLETMPTCPGAGLRHLLLLCQGCINSPKTGMRLRNQELCKGCPTPNNSVICTETWHILSPRHLHKPWGAFSADFTEMSQGEMKFWFPTPRNIPGSVGVLLPHAQ